MLDPFIERLRSKREVEGIVVLSSAARTGERHSFDRESDIDMAVFISVPLAPDEWRATSKEAATRLGDRIPAWLPNFSFVLPMPWGPVELNVHQQIYECEADPRTVWKESKREAYAYTREIVYDRRGRLAALIEERARYDEDEQRRRMARLANRLHWDLRRLPERQARRGDVVGAHHVVNVAFEEVVESVFLLVRRFLPHPKWRLQTIARLGLLENVAQDRLVAALRTEPTSSRDLHRRIGLLEEVWGRVRERAGTLVPSDPYRYYSAHVSGEQQLRTITVADEVARPASAPHDLANYLVPGSRGELHGALCDDAVAIPDGWEATRIALRDALGCAQGSESLP